MRSCTQISLLPAINWLIALDSDVVFGGNVLCSDLLTVQSSGKGADISTKMYKHKSEWLDLTGPLKTIVVKIYV